jgi:hypothetical protein
MILGDRKETVHNSQPADTAAIDETEDEYPF